MINAKLVSPRIFSLGSARQPEQINRAQDITGDEKLTQTQIYEIGRELKVGVHKEIPAVTWGLTQLEYGNVAMYRDIACLLDPATSTDDASINLKSMRTTAFTIAAYLTDDDGTFKGTVVFPALRVDGFSIDIGNPEAIITRKFSFVGEDIRIVKDKYLAYETATVVGVGSAETNLDIVLTGTPLEIAAGKYIYSVYLSRGTDIDEVLEDETKTVDGTYSYNNSTKTITIDDVKEGDIYKVFYASATAYTDLWTDDDSDEVALYADCVDIFLKVGTSEEIHRLQTINIDAKFARTDYKEIGNPNVVQRGSKDEKVTVKLDRYNEGFSLEDILASDTTYCDINPRDFSANIQLLIKIYTDNTKTTFKMGYLVSNLSPTNINVGQMVQDYQKIGTTLESDNLKISEVESEVAFA